MVVTKCWKMYSDHGSWVCKTLAWLKPSSLHMTPGLKARRCPERTSAWYVCARSIILQRINHSRFKHHSLALHFEVMNVVNGQFIAWSKLHHIAEHVMAWFQSAATTLFTMSAKASAWQFLRHIMSHCSDMPLPVCHTSNLAILGRGACNLMRLGSLHSDLVAMQPQMGQHPVDS